MSYSIGRRQQQHHILLILFHFMVVSHVYMEVLAECEGQASFGRHPSDTYVREGENAVFTCMVEQFHPEWDKLTWHVSPDNLVTIISDSFDDSTLEFSSEIIVHNVGRRDQTFTCVLRSFHEGYLLPLCSSRVATLHVQYFPGDDEITCGPRSLGELHERSVLEVWCTVPEGNPPVNLSWKIGNSNSSFTEFHGKSKRLLTFNQDVHLNYTLHGKSLYCIASSQGGIFQDQEISCSVGPLLVRHKPQIVIQSSEIIASVDDPKLQQMRLNCIASGYPEVKLYEWFCTPEGLLNGCHNASSKTLVLDTKAENIRFSAITDDLFVSCSATNSEGTTTAVFSLPGHETGSRVPASNTDAYPSVSLKYRNIVPRLDLFNQSVCWEMFSFHINIICSFGCNGIDASDAVITWLVNENEITQDNTNGCPPAASSLNFEGNFSKHDIIYITCKVQIQNETYKTSANLTFAEPINTKSNSSIISNNEPNNLGIGTSTVTSISYTEEMQIKLVPASWFELSGIKMIVFISVAVLAGLLLTACICALCTVCLFKFWQHAHAVGTQKLTERGSSGHCVSEQVPRQDNQNDKTSDDGRLYEEPIKPSPPMSPLPLVPPKEDQLRIENGIYVTDLSQDECVSYNSSGYTSSGRSSHTCSDISIPSGDSELSHHGHQTYAEPYEGVGLNCINFDRIRHMYDNDGVIQMHTSPR